MGQTTEKPQIQFAEALELAHQLRRELLPYCERVWIGGSVRRRKETVGDIELVCIPKPGEPTPVELEGQAGLFGEPPVQPETTPAADQLSAYLENECSLSFSEWSLRPNQSGYTTFGPKNKLLLHGTTPVDVFSGTWANFGMLFFVRTGDAGWVREVMAQLKAQNQHGHPYGGVEFYIEGMPGSGRAITAEYMCEREERVFEILGWPFVNPWERTEKAARWMRRKFR